MEHAKLWRLVLDELEISVSNPTFRTFFAKSTLVGFESGVATIGCANAVATQMIETRYYALIKKILDKHSGQNTSLLFKISGSAERQESPGPLFSPAPASPVSQPAAQLMHPHHLRGDYTFESFAVSTSNQMAYAAATAVAATPGTSYNPLFFYGGVGVGKTHLMQAIGTAVLMKKPQTRIIYCMGEEFTNEIIDAIQTKTTKRFKNKYRSAQILLIDDIQFIAGKNAVQEEFFHTFNAIQREGGQIVLTSDRPPQEIERLEERLRSRFEQGLLVDVQNPDFELRCAILRIKAQQRGIDLKMPIAQILAAPTESVRKLEGLLTRLVTEAELTKQPITDALARRLVGLPENSEPNPLRRVVTPRQVLEAVSRKFGITSTELKGTNRSRPIVRPRQILMYLLRTDLRLPLDEVGALVGGRDHSTVLHAVTTVKNLMSTNPQTLEDISGIKQELFG